MQKLKDEVDIGSLEFEVGFWHPFGTHAGETAIEIIERKRDEINKNGWTLWSFQFRKTLKSWYGEIKKINPSRVLVFCSEGNSAIDPIGEMKYCNYYLPVDEVESKKIPQEIKIPHPMGRKTKGSAFVVKNIIFPINSEVVPIEWFKDNEWQTRTLPTRPEYLIRPGVGHDMRKFRAILELKAPYLAEVGIS